MMNHEYAHVNGIRLHYVSAGHGPLLLFLHGFPSFWYTWRDQFAAFSSAYRVVAPDLRGYNLSDKPTAIEQYQLSYLVEDIRALIASLDQRPCVLIGHDWGGVVAWAFAAAYPEYLEKLIVINQPPLNITRRALYSDPLQRQRCDYMLMLHRPDAEAILAADNFALLVRSELQAGLDRGHFSAADTRAYLAAWAQPGALRGGINYYRAARFIDLFTEEGRQQIANPEIEFALPTVHVPSLLIWGEQDPFKDTDLALTGVEQSTPYVTIKRVPDGSHWIVYEHPTLVNRLIHTFITS